MPKRDPSKELWEGARSGVDGAMQLTGVDEAYNTDDINKYLDQYLHDHRSFMTWYDYKKPAHLEYHHQYFTDFLRQNKYGFVRSPRQLVQTLRVLKSEAEIRLAEQTCQIASQAFIEVMKFSKPEVINDPVLLPIP